MQAAVGSNQDWQTLSYVLLRLWNIFLVFVLNRIYNLEE